MVRALKGRTRQGARYRRKQSVDRELKALLDRDEAELPTVLRNRAVSPEALVYLVRWLAPSISRSLALSSLLRSAEMAARRVVPRGRNVGTIREDLVSELSELVALACRERDTATLDFFEVDFRRAMKFLAHRMIRGEARRVRREAKVAFDGTFVLLPNHEERVFLADVRRWVLALPPNLREPLVLARIKGIPIEASSGRYSVASICRVSPRTVRSRIARATQALRDRSAPAAHSIASTPTIKKTR